MQDAGCKRNVGDPGVAFAKRERLARLVKFVALTLFEESKQPAYRVEHVPVDADSRLHVVGTTEGDGPEPRVCFLPPPGCEANRCWRRRSEVARQPDKARRMAHRQLLQPVGSDPASRHRGAMVLAAAALGRAPASQPLVLPPLRFPRRTVDRVEIDGPC